MALGFCLWHKSRAFLWVIPFLNVDRSVHFTMPHFIILSYGFGDFYSFIIISQCLHTNAQCSSLIIQKSFFGALQSVDLHVFDSTFFTSDFYFSRCWRWGCHRWAGNVVCASGESAKTMSRTNLAIRTLLYLQTFFTFFTLSQCAAKLNVPKVLLPFHTDSYTHFTLAASDGCYTW